MYHLMVRLPFLTISVVCFDPLHFWLFVIEVPTQPKVIISCLGEGVFKSQRVLKHMVDKEVENEHVSVYRLIWRSYRATRWYGSVNYIGENVSIRYIVVGRSFISFLYGSHERVIANVCRNISRRIDTTYFQVLVHTSITIQYLS